MVFALLLDLVLVVLGATPLVMSYTLAHQWSRLEIQKYIFSGRWVEHITIETYLKILPIVYSAFSNHQTGISLWLRSQGSYHLYVHLCQSSAGLPSTGRITRRVLGFNAQISGWYLSSYEGVASLALFNVLVLILCSITSCLFYGHYLMLNYFYTAICANLTDWTFLWLVL